MGKWIDRERGDQARSYQLRGIFPEHDTLVVHYDTFLLQRYQMPERVEPLDAQQLTENEFRLFEVLLDKFPGYASYKDLAIRYVQYVLYPYSQRRRAEILEALDENVLAALLEDIKPLLISAREKTRQLGIDISAILDTGYILTKPFIKTADVAVLCNEHILLIKRRRKPYKGVWALPGGKQKEFDMLFEFTALRELHEETGLDCSLFRLDEVGTFSGPERDPRGVYTTKVFRIDIETLHDDELPAVKGSDDALEAHWVPLSALSTIELAFDHEEIIRCVLKKGTRS